MTEEPMEVYGLFCFWNVLKPLHKQFMKSILVDTTKGYSLKKGEKILKYEFSLNVQGKNSSV